MTATIKPVSLSTDGEAGPYIMTPVQYVDQVRNFLVDRGIRFNLDHASFQRKGIPEFTVFNISRDCRKDQVTEIEAFLNGSSFVWELNIE